MECSTLQRIDRADHKAMMARNGGDGGGTPEFPIAPIGCLPEPPNPRWGRGLHILSTGGNSKMISESKGE